MEKYIRDLIRQGEHQQLDFKFEITDSKKIARSMVAFANTDGGKLLVGVKDNGKIAGIRSDEEYYMLEAAANMYCKPTINFEVHPWTIEGKTILEVDIPKSQNIPHYAPDQNDKWKVYVRSGDQNRLANSVLLKLWKRKKTMKGTLIKYSEKEKTLLNYLKDNEAVSLNMVRKLTGLSKFKAELILVNLLAIEVLDLIFDENGALYSLKKDTIIE